MNNSTDETIYTFDVPQDLLVLIRDALHFVSQHKEQYIKESMTPNVKAIEEFKDSLDYVVRNAELIDALQDKTRILN